MRRINLNQYRKELRRLQDAQKASSEIAIVYASADEDGMIRALMHYGPPFGRKQSEIEYFNNLEGLLQKTGITEKTTIIIDDLEVHAEMYLPADPILFYCTPEQRMAFMEWASDDHERWLVEYHRLCASVKEQGLELPDSEALNDLMENFGAFTPAELVKRYQEVRWFKTGGVTV